MAKRGGGERRKQRAARAAAGRRRPFVTVRSAAIAALVIAGGFFVARWDRAVGEVHAPFGAAAATVTGDERSGHERMVALLADIARRTDEANPYLSATLGVAPLPPDAPPDQVFRWLGQSAHREARLGHEERVVEILEEARALCEKTPEYLDAGDLAGVNFRLGVACLRVGETQNCCLRSTAESCILPIRAGGLHTRTEGSRGAISRFTEVIRSVPAGTALGLKARWLLNIAYMTLGEWPEAVPPPYLIPPSVLESDEPFPRFPNVAQQLGLDTFNLAGGAIVEDFDNDGDLDLMTSTFDTRGPMHCFVNEGAAGFVERTQESGLEGMLGGLNMVHADYDGDGWSDVLVLRGAWLGAAGRHPKSLLRNEGDGTFRDVTFEAGLGERFFPTQTAAWADYDLDGDLDVYVGAECSRDTGTQPVAPEARTTHEAGQLFRNEGDGTFRDVASEAGVENFRFAKGVVWGDFDGDRLPDLYVSNLGWENRLYRNRGDGTFEDVAPRLGVTKPLNSFPCWFWDFDNDGDLDIYVSTFRGSPDALAWIVADYLDIEVIGSDSPCLYRNDGGRFTDVAIEQGVDRESLSMGANFGDIDGDGWLDFHLGTGYPDYEGLTPNVMYRNRGGTGFSDVTMAGGFGHLQKGHAIAFADMDNDGDQDVFSQLGGAYPGDAYGDALYANPGFGTRWLTLKLTGTRSNRSAIGARIRVDVVEEGRERTIYRHVNSGGSFGANPFRQTIGLGRAERIAQLEIWWPVTDERQVFRDVPLDSFLEIVEGADDYGVRPLVASPFPTAAVP
jgi:hypothetical protein